MGETHDIEALMKVYGGIAYHPRTGERIVSLTSEIRKEKPKSSPCSPKVSHNRVRNQQLKSGCYIINNERGIPAIQPKGVIKMKRTAQWSGVWTIQKRKRTSGGHSWFDSNPNRQ